MVKKHTQNVIKESNIRGLLYRDLPIEIMIKIKRM